MIKELFELFTLFHISHVFKLPCSIFNFFFAIHSSKSNLSYSTFLSTRKTYYFTNQHIFLICFLFQEIIFLDRQNIVYRIFKTQNRPLIRTEDKIDGGVYFLFYVSNDLVNLLQYVPNM